MQFLKNWGVCVDPSSLYCQSVLQRSRKAKPTVLKARTSLPEAQNPTRDKSCKYTNPNSSRIHDGLQTVQICKPEKQEKKPNKVDTMPELMQIVEIANLHTLRRFISYFQPWLSWTVYWSVQNLIYFPGKSTSWMLCSALCNWAFTYASITSLHTPTAYSKPHACTQTKLRLYHHICIGLWWCTIRYGGRTIWNAQPDEPVIISEQDKQPSRKVLEHC